MLGVEPSGQWQAQPGPLATLGKEALSLLGLLSRPDGKEAEGTIQRKPRGKHTHCPDGTVSPAPSQASGRLTPQEWSVRLLSEH